MSWPDGKSYDIHLCLEWSSFVEMELNIAKEQDCSIIFIQMFQWLPR